MSYVLRFRENQIEKWIRLPEHAILVGRSSSCDLTLSDPAISRRHIRLTPRHDGVHLEDLDSSNGTFMNGLRVRDERLTCGSRVVLGAYAICIGDMPESGFHCHGLACANDRNLWFQGAANGRDHRHYLRVLVLDGETGLYYCESCFVALSLGRGPCAGAGLMNQDGSVTARPG